MVTRAKAAMMAAIDHHRKRVPQSQRYYEKKRAEGKIHNQAIRALGRDSSLSYWASAPEGRRSWSSGCEGPLSRGRRPLDPRQRTRR